MPDEAKCEVCGEPMPKGEEIFKFHGYSGPCPKPPLPTKSKQLFVRVPNSDGQLWHCGGPDLEAAVNRLRNILANGGDDGESLPVELEIREMTEAEIAAIQEC